MANLLENFSLPDHILQRHCRKAKCNLSQVYDLDCASSAMLQLHASKHLPAHPSAYSPTEFVEFGEFSRPYSTGTVNLRGLHKLPARGEGALSVRRRESMHSCQKTFNLPSKVATSKHQNKHQQATGTQGQQTRDEFKNCEGLVS